MSLQIWLPLNGDINNCGVSNATIINNGATVNSAGKIGSCYSFDGSDDYISIDSASLRNLISGDSNPFSFSFWIYHADSTRAIIFGDYNLSGTISFNIELNTSHGIRFYWGGSPDLTFSNSSVSINVWSHVSITYSGSELKCYINGNLVDSRSVTLSTKTKSSGVYYLGRDNRTGSTALNGRLNDFRVYNHCLSYSEVKEIYKSLILHYPLNKSSIQIMTNCYSYPTFNTSSESGGWSHWGQSGASGSYSQNTDKTYIFPGFSNYSHCFSDAAGATGNYLLYQSPAFEGGWRSLCAIVKESNSLPITESIVHPAWNANTSSTKGKAGKWTSITSLGNGFYLCKREGINQDGSNDLVGLYCHPGYTVYVTCAYLENDRECCSDMFDQNNSTVYDCSGYRNDGTATSSLIINDYNQKRYNLSTYFDTTQYIAAGTKAKVTDEISVCVWAKMDTWDNNTRLASCTQSGGWNFESDSNRISWPVYVSGVGYVSCTSDRTWDSLSSGWHFFVGTYDGINSKLYIDGVLDKTISNGQSTKTPIGYHTSNGIFVHAEATSSATTPSTGYSAMSMSDFRIYATALSADDVVSLYKVSASIDKNKTLYCYELMEE